MFISVIHLSLWPIAWITINQPKEIAALTEKSWCEKASKARIGFHTSLDNNVWLVVNYSKKKRLVVNHSSDSDGKHNKHQLPAYNFFYEKNQLFLEQIIDIYIYVTLVT